MALAPPELDRPPRTLSDVERGDHLCLLYENEAQHRQVFTPYLRQGLLADEKVLYIADERGTDVIEDYLRASGLDPAPYIASGQLTLLTSDVYAQDGSFDPDATIAMLGETLDEALEAGYKGMRGSGEMSWMLGETPGSDRALEYEAKLNRFFPGKPFLAICQYNMRRFPGHLLREALTTHPYAVLGTQVYDNFYYVPPELYLSPQRDRAVLDRWIQNLRNHLAFQEERLRSRLQHFELEQLRVLERMQAEFINEASHEFATPLTPLRLQLSMLRQAMPPDARKALESVAVMERSVERLATSLDRVLRETRKEGRRGAPPAGDEDGAGDP